MNCIAENRTTAIAALDRIPGIKVVPNLGSIYPFIDLSAHSLATGYSRKRSWQKPDLSSCQAVSAVCHPISESTSLANPPTCSPALRG